MTRARSLANRALDFVSVKDFGAVGDGVTDDTAAIQAALNNANGRTIVFPSGTYITGPLLYAPSVSGSLISMVGEWSVQGRAGSLIQRKTGFVGNTLLHISNANTPSGTGYVAVNIKDMAFEGFYEVNYLVRISRTSGCRIEGCSFYRASNTALLIGETGESFGTEIENIYILGQDYNWSTTPTQIGLDLRARYAKLDRMVCDGSRVGIAAGGDQLFIQNCHLEGVLQGIRMDTSGGGQLSVSNNWVLQYGNHIIDANYPSAGFYIKGTAPGAANNSSFVANRVTAATYGFYFKDTEYHTLIGNQAPSVTTMVYIDVTAGTRPFFLAGNFPSSCTDVNGTAILMNVSAANASQILSNSALKLPVGVNLTPTSPVASGGSYTAAFTSDNRSTFAPTTISYTFDHSGLKQPAIQSIASSASGGYAYLSFKSSYFNNTQTEMLVMNPVALAVSPGNDNTISSGNSGNRWSAIWSANGTIQTSDAREKTNIQDSQLGLSFINSLRPVSYTWISGGKERQIIEDGELEVTIEPAVSDENGKEITPAVTKTEKKWKEVFVDRPGTRKHFGLIAQEVKAAIEASGVGDFAGHILTDKDNPDSSQALRYDQFIAPLVKAVQELSAQVDLLKKQTKVNG